MCSQMHRKEQDILPFYFSIHGLLTHTCRMKEKTGSSKGAAILKEWDTNLPLFWQLVPPSEEDTPEACAAYEANSAGQVTSLQSA